MSKKVSCVIAAVLCFFAGAVLVTEFPTIATLITFIEMAAGFACGFFFKKFEAEEKEAIYLEEIDALKEQVKLCTKIESFKKKTKKVKEN